MKVIVRREPAPWRTPRFKAFQPSGVALGATVTDGTITGQVWSQAPTTPSGRYWFVVTPDGKAHECWERSLMVLGQCIDTTLPQARAA